MYWYRYLSFVISLPLSSSLSVLPHKKTVYITMHDMHCFLISLISVSFLKKYISHHHFQMNTV